MPLDFVVVTWNHGLPLPRRECHSSDHESCPKPPMRLNHDFVLPTWNGDVQNESDDSLKTTLPKNSYNELKNSGIPPMANVKS